MRNKNIQIIRILATVMVYFCHIANLYGFNAIGQMLSSAVFIFLIITGYLYGAKKIENKRKWLSKKIIQIQKPVCIWIVSIVCFGLIIGIPLKLSVIPIYVFALQGFLKGFIGIDFGFQALSHLWYLSFALLGYLLIAIINETKLEKIIKNNTLKTILILFVLMIMLSVFRIGLGTKIAYIAVLMIAYFNSEKINRIKPIVSIILMLASILIRVIFKKTCDGSFVYDEVIYSVTQATIALSIFCLVLSAKIRINKGTKVIDFLDKKHLFLLYRALCLHGSYSAHQSSVEYNTNNCHGYIELFCINVCSKYRCRR